MSMSLLRVELWTDGACRGNPGPGGWAAILLAPAGDVRELSGAEEGSTNNRMEMRAIISGLQALKRRCEVHIHTDSSYVLNAFQENWIAGWQKRGWKTSARKPVANLDLWLELIEQVDRHQITWVKVKGHSGVALNERADVLAVEASHSI